MGRKRSGKRKRAPRRSDTVAVPSSKPVEVETETETEKTSATTSTVGTSTPPRLLLVGALIVAVAATVGLAPGLAGELLNWDDNRFVQHNELIRGF